MPLVRPIPGRRAQAPRMGLVVSAEKPAEPESVWKNGISYDVESCVVPDTPRDICSPGSFGTAQEPTTSEWEAYVVAADWTCSTFGQSDIQAAYEAARRRLMATWGFQVERELWTGTLAQAQSYPNRWLADAANVVELSVGGLTPIEALACLTQYLAENAGGQQGMIHATPQVVTHWDQLGALHRQGNVILTKTRDDIVVAGNGYTGSNPDGDAASAGNVWAYATDIVEVREGETDPEDIGGQGPIPWVDPTNNRITVRAQKRALASFEGCRHAGTQIALDPCVSGS
jgi:hypothetical protein